MATVRASEITSTWSGNTGDWTDATQWSTNPDYPNNGTPAGVEYDALINAPGAGAYTVSLSSSITTDSVTLSSPNATISQTGGTLTTGAVNISAGRYVLSGGTLATPSYTNTGGTFAASVPVTFTDPTFNNAGGTIEADAGGKVTLSLPGTVTTVQLGNLVTNGGSIAIYPSFGTIDNTGQTLTFLGSTGSVSIAGTTVLHGVIDFPSNAFVGQETRFSAVTLASDVTVNGDNCVIQTINAAGHSINLLDATLFAYPQDNSVSSVTLGNINVNLGGASPNSATRGFIVAFAVGGGPIDLTLAKDATIRGWGGAGITFSGTAIPRFTNQGIISADVFAKTLAIKSFIFTNNGTLRAANGGMLSIAPTPMSFTNNGILAVDSISSINVNASLTLTGGSAFDATLGSNGASGILSIAGDLSLPKNVSLNLDLAPGTIFSSPYEIISYAGSLKGTFTNVTPGFTVDYSHAGEVLITSVPEPTAGLLLAIGSAGILARRRRRYFPSQCPC